VREYQNAVANASVNRLAARIRVYNVTMELHGWDSDGHWQGPRDLRTFLRSNRVFAAFWLVVLSGMGLAVATDVVDSGLTGIPLGLLVAWVVWFAFMYGFAHGWIAEGD
jgi:hypothetical protein